MPKLGLGRGCHGFAAAPSITFTLPLNNFRFLTSSFAWTLVHLTLTLRSRSRSFTLNHDSLSMTMVVIKDEVPQSSGRTPPHSYHLQVGHFICVPQCSTCNARQELAERVASRPRP